jgi:hypothetical protein
MEHGGAHEIPALKRLRQENLKFAANLGYIVQSPSRLHSEILSQINKQIKWDCIKHKYFYTAKKIANKVKKQL